MRLIGRKKEIDEISERNIRYPDNVAFFGVVGLGKSSIIESLFSRANCKKYAEEYQALYVKTILDKDMKGEDLTDFLLDITLSSIELIKDESIRNEIYQAISTTSSRFHRKDSILRQTLEIIKEYEYTLVLVMDNFHNMGRSNDVGSEQYDFLRSLNELGLVYYWIISDSDFSDVYATSQFTTSFFAQKFRPRTISQMNHNDMMQLLEEKANRCGTFLSPEMKSAIFEIIGGIPGFVDPAIKLAEEINGLHTDDTFKNKLIQLMLEDSTCLSMLTSWSRSLTIEQKQILIDFSEREKTYEKEIESINAVNQLGDKSGLGLLISCSDERGNYWTINNELYRAFIISKREDFFAADIVSSKDKEDIISPSPTYIQNTYYINNNFFNPDSAVNSLLLLKDISRNGRMLLPEQGRIDRAIQCLPYQQDGWETLNDDQKDEQMNSYADRIFESEDFIEDDLSESQLQRFHLSAEYLSTLSDPEKTSLISAVQVYDILQICKERFGLSMINSESARGILFARFYESLLKDKLTPALTSIELTSKWLIPVKGGSIPLYKFKRNRLTLGNFSSILEKTDSREALTSVCQYELGNSEYDDIWWEKHWKDIAAITDLRNICCHSGNEFDEKRLADLLFYLFEKDTVIKSELYDSIACRHRHTK